MKEDTMSGAEDTYDFDLTKELQEVVDMTTTDNDGHETIDTSNKIDLRKDTERTTRKQRVQKEEEEGGTTRSRSRPQPPKGAPPAPQHPQHKRSLKGARSNPNDEKHLAELFTQGDDLVTGKAWNSWIPRSKPGTKEDDQLQNKDP